MEAEFSEKYYEILFNAEFLNCSKVNYVFIPSQTFEGKCHFDALFRKRKKRVVIFQFKVPSFLKKKQKYKFNLYEKPTYLQHTKLCNYNSLNKKVKAFYCSPIFHTLKDLWRFRNSGDIKSNSKLFFPSAKTQIPQGTNNQQHYIEYDQKTAKMYCDNGIDIDMFSFETLLEKIEPITKKQFEKEYNDSLKELINCHTAFLFF